MKSDWYCTIQTVTICQLFKKASKNYKDEQSARSSIIVE